MPPASRLPAPTAQRVAEHGAVQLGPGADARTAHEDAAFHLCVSADHDALLHHRLQHRGALADDCARAEHDERTHAGACAHSHAVGDVARRHDASAGGDLRRRRDVQVLLAERFPGFRLELPLEDVEVRLQVAVGRADVAPVPLVHVAVERAGGGELGEHAALDGEQPAARDHLEHLGLEHVHAGVDQRRALPLPGLLEEARHRPVLAELDQPVAARVLDGREEDGAHAAPAAVRRGEGGEVDVAEHVAVEDEKARVVQASLAVGDGSGRAERLVLDAVVHFEAVGRAVADDGLDGLRQEPRGEDGPLHAVPHEVVEDVRDERALYDRRHRLGHARRDGAEARTLAPDEDDGLSRMPLGGAHPRLIGGRASRAHLQGRCPRTRGLPRPRRPGR